LVLAETYYPGKSCGALREKGNAPVKAIFRKRHHLRKEMFIEKSSV
jgi:hypothetical protein